jgi:twitching motility two-component system response regulator PilG
MNTNLLSPLKVLAEQSQQNYSGCIIFVTPKDASVSWKVYFREGRLQYATSAIGQEERLTYLWQQFQVKVAPPEFISADTEYEALYKWGLNLQLPESDWQKLVVKLTEEALLQIIRLEQASVKSIPNLYIQETIIDFSWQFIEAKIKEFTNKSLDILLNFNSPFSRLYLSQSNSFKSYKLWKNLAATSELGMFFTSHDVSLWLPILSQKYSLYKLAVKLELDLLTLTRNLQPFLKEKLIEVLPWEASITQVANKINNPVVTKETPQEKQGNSVDNKVASKLLIACIDDSNTVQKQVTMILESVGYQVINITDPSNALKSLARQNPVLILMDINMPGINGYDLCGMLRRSRKFEVIPIVMLTGRDGIIDRMRAKFVGASNYLTKPVAPNELIELVQQLTKSATLI